MKKIISLFIIGTIAIQPALSQSTAMADSTTIPAPKSEHLQLDASREAFKKNLLNKPLKDFRLTDLDKKAWNLSELKGKVVVINFWFTTCKPCIIEMPHLNELVADNKDNPVVFIAPAPEDETRVRKFLKRYSFDYHIIPSSLEYISASGIENFPTHLIVDKKGTVRQVFIGYADDIKKKIQTEVDKLLK